MLALTVVFLLAFSPPEGVFGQLIVNVKNQGGDILRETIDSNVTADTITLDFQQADGTLVTQFIDFKNVILSLDYRQFVQYNYNNT